MCLADGTDLLMLPSSSKPPEDPENGDYWGSFTDEGVFQGGMIANH